MLVGGFSISSPLPQRMKIKNPTFTIKEATPCYIRAEVTCPEGGMMRVQGSLSPPHAAWSLLLSCSKS